jgi:hypothetical protein
LNEPHFGLLQLTFQITPMLFGSFATVAVSSITPPVCSEPGAVCVNVTFSCPSVEADDFVTQPE